MDPYRDILGSELSEERLSENLAAFEDILEAIRMLRTLDLTDVYPAVVYDPLLPYRVDP